MNKVDTEEVKRWEQDDVKPYEIIGIPLGTCLFRDVTIHGYSDKTTYGYLFAFTYLKKKQINHEMVYEKVERRKDKEEQKKEFERAENELLKKYQTETGL